MNYYIGKLEQTICGYESTIVFKFKTDADPDNYLLNVASTFWGKGDDENGDGVFYFDGGTVAVSPYDHQQISKEVWDSISIINNINLANEKETA
jgi:hypothetical protein